MHTLSRYFHTLEVKVLLLNETTVLTSFLTFFFQVISSLFFSNLYCSSIRYTVLLLDDAFINTKVMDKFAAKETYAANRIYGNK